jgi:hypothetical protein
MTKKNKYINILNELNHYKYYLPSEYKHYYDEITSLYKNRYIESKAKARKLLETLSNKRFHKKAKTPLVDDIGGAMDYIESFRWRQDEHEHHIKFVPLEYHEPIKGIKEKHQLRDFYLVSNFKRYERWRKVKKLNGKTILSWSNWKRRKKQIAIIKE